MPNVPNAPGVPALASFGADVVALISDDLSFAFAGNGAPEWGVFLNGVPVLENDNVIQFEFKQDTPVSDYPQEEGAFQSYDKVQLPGDIRLRVSAGGSVSNRQAMLQSITDVFNTTDLYDVLTPEQVFVGYNFTHRDWRRRAGDVGIIAVDLWLTEIRVTSTATFSNTQQPGDAGQKNSGNVQPQPTSAYIDQKFATDRWKVT